MDWKPEDRSPGGHYHFLTSAIAPRPIAWVTTVDGDGRANLAPFSYFQGVGSDPPMLMLSVSDRPERAGGGPKDTLRNIQETGEFVVHVVPTALAAPMVASAAPLATLAPDEDELAALGLDTEPSIVVAPPRLADCPVAMECRLVETRRFGDRVPVTVVFGEVVHFHADDAVLDERGNVRPRGPDDPDGVAFLARLGGHRYLAVHETFEVPAAGASGPSRKE